MGGSLPLLLIGSGVLSGLEPGDLAVGGDALARRQRDVARGAVALAEAALDAAVHDAAGRRAGLQMLQVHLWVLQPQGTHCQGRTMPPARRQLQGAILTRPLCAAALNAVTTPIWQSRWEAPGPGQACATTD